MRVKYLEAMFFYDRPLMYSATVEGGGLALVMLIDEIDHPNELNRRGTAAQIGLCMVVEVSSRRLQAIRSNCLTTREAFRFPENRRAYEMTELDGWWEFNECTPLAVIPERWLSSGGVRLVYREGRSKRPRRALTPRERRRKTIRQARNIEHRPERSWSGSIWRINEHLREQRAAREAKIAAETASTAPPEK